MASASDIAALRERYKVERDRRATPDSGRTYLDISVFAPLHADPYSDAVPRAAIDDAVDVLIVGGGFGGLLTAARLREAGVETIRIVEVGGDFGGTWYWNRYPGAACDIESYIYMPLLEETGYMPTERYAKADEIRAHARRIGEHFDLYRHALFGTQVTSLDWDGEAARWRVVTDRGDRMTARFIVLSTGPLNKPKLPAIPGIESFTGHSFHTSRWDYAYTGGSNTQPMTRLAGKRVGIIGTGATAIQCVPPLAAASGHLFVFQRTPSSVDYRGNAPTDPAWAAGLTPGWQQRRMENFTKQMAGVFDEEDAIGDGWTVLARAVRARLAEDPALAPRFMELLETADFEKMVSVRDNIGNTVTNPATAEALKPWFSLFCKRPCFHDDYLDVFNRPNVTLVDTEGRGVEAITGESVVVGGKDYPLDCLIFATGFEVSTDFARRAGFKLNGVGGVPLSTKWATGMTTLHGLFTRDFPNAFFVSQAQAGMSPNFPHMLSEQAKHIAHVVAACTDRGITTIEASADAERDWTRTIVDLSHDRLKFLETCTPGYYNGEGNVSPQVAQSLPYGAGPVAFIALLRQWRDGGDFEGLELDGAHARTMEAVQ